MNEPTVKTGIVAINEECREAINDSLFHLLFGVTPYEHTLLFIERLNKTIMEIQGWLFFTSGSLASVMSNVVKDTESTELFFNLHVLFLNRVNVDDDKLKLIKESLSNSFDIRKQIQQYEGNDHNVKMSLIPDEYLQRMNAPGDVLSILNSNPLLVTILCLWLYLDTDELGRRLILATEANRITAGKGTTK